jgi:20S proteasome subunit alpha 4
VAEQVQYAEKAAQKGAPAVALSNQRDSVVLCVERRRSSPLEHFSTSEKISEVQDNVFITFAGLAADGRRLVDKTRVFAETHRFRLSEPASVRDIAVHIAGEPARVCAEALADDDDITPRLAATTV